MVKTRVMDVCMAYFEIKRDKGKNYNFEHDFLN